LNTIGFLAAATVWAQSSTVNVQVGNQINTSVGVDGRLQLAMSTSFQLAQWSYNYFQATPAAPANLTALNPFHTRVQVIQQAVPLTAADSWDFTYLNSMLSPLQATGDHSPEFQIGTAPAFLSSGSGQILPASIPAFGQMAANMVSYYNTGGFTDAGTHYQSPTPYPVTWWGIFNEPDINGVTAQNYVTLYNTAVPAMAQADPNVKFVAVELAGAPGSYIPVFATGVTARVDVVAKHFYSTCNQRDYDETLFETIPSFASQVQTMYQDLALNPALAKVPVWITENNVNADFSNNGISNCNPPLKFVTDLRGSSAFFGAWRSLVFEQLGEAGAQALYQWSFGSDPQYGETDGNGNPQFSYWVDYYLSHWLPSPPGQDILQTTTSGCCTTASEKTWQGGALVYDTQTLAARNVDGSVVVLMSNYAINGEFDNNGTGLSRTFALDLSALGSFSSATLVTLDAATPAATGPVPQSLTPAAQMQVTLPGYGAALLRLSNTQPVVTAAGVANAASLTAGPVSPGEIVSIFGSGLGPAAGAIGQYTYPTLISNALEGVHVLFDGVPAPITYAGAGQVNAVVPYEVAGKANTQLQVEYLGAVSAAVSLPVANVSPGLFTAASSGTGQAAVLNISDYTVNSAANPAARGAYVSIFGTGIGVTTPAGADGMLAAAPYGQVNPNLTVSVTMGGIACTTNYVGAAPGLIAGALQINAQVPAGVTPGPSVPLVVTIGGVPSRSGVTLAVK
jgi:uncharacterized protein (TIGR03437 family)